MTPQGPLPRTERTHSAQRTARAPEGTAQGTHQAVRSEAVLLRLDEVREEVHVARLEPLRGAGALLEHGIGAPPAGGEGARAPRRRGGRGRGGRRVEGRRRLLRREGRVAAAEVGVGVGAGVGGLVRPRRGVGLGLAERGREGGKSQWGRSGRGTRRRESRGGVLGRAARARDAQAREVDATRGTTRRLT